MAIWGYARGESLKAQRQEIDAYAIKHGMTLDGVAIEERGVRAVAPIADRPIGGPLFAKLGKGDIVIVAVLDRLFCSAVDSLKVVADLERRGVALHILNLGGDMASEGRMDQLVTFANAFQWGEREIGDRMGEAIRQRKRDDKARGRYTGGPVPFGFKLRDDGKLVKDKGQQRAIALMVKMKADDEDGELSLRTIAAAMADEGFKLTHGGVAGILKAHKHDVWKVRSSRAQARIVDSACGEGMRSEEVNEDPDHAAQGRHGDAQPSGSNVRDGRKKLGVGLE
jgi:putative DNA-invertase from lambdoid prophage Rac